MTKENPTNYFPCGIQHKYYDEATMVGYASFLGEHHNYSISNNALFTNVGGEAVNFLSTKF